MNKHPLKLMTLLTSLFISGTSFAQLGEGLLVNLGLTYKTSSTKTVYSGTQEDQSSEREGTEIILNFSGGYSLGNGMLAGIKYYNTAEGSKSGDDKFDTERDALGFMAGYNFDSFLAQFSYMALTPPSIKASTNNGNDTVEYKEGRGYIFDFMYMFKIGGVFFGPQISYVSFTYEKLLTNDVEVEEFESYTETDLIPLFSIVGIF